MKIIYRKKFKKLREEYADLGECKLDLIEEMVRTNSGYSEQYSSYVNSCKVKVDLDKIDEATLSRGWEYYLKYRNLVNKREDIHGTIAISSIGVFTAWFIKKCVDVGKNNATLEEEYKRGRSDVYKDIEEHCRDCNCGDSWIGDTSDGKHMILRISDEETEDYKEFQESLKELDEYDDEI